MPSSLVIKREFLVDAYELYDGRWEVDFESYEHPGLVRNQKKGDKAQKGRQKLH